MLDVRRILLFTEVARRGSVTATARALNYTPSAVSQQISRLETEAGQPLLERHARGVTVTDAGRALAERGQRIERELQAAENELADFAGLRAGTLRIGTFPTVGASLLPQAVIAFRDAHPDVRLTVRSARIAGLWAMLENREIEMSLMWDYDWSRIDREDIVVTPSSTTRPPFSSATTILSPDASPPRSPTSHTTPGSPAPTITRWPKPLSAAAAPSASSPTSPTRRTTTRKPRPWSPPASVSPSPPPWPWRASGPASPSSLSGRRARSAASSWCAWPTTRSPPPP